MTIKGIYFLCVFTPRITPHSKNWTLDFEPAFLQRFYSPLSPRSFFQNGQRFPILKHVTSGSGDVTSGHVTSGEPAIFPTGGQRFPPPNHVTSGCLSPRSLFPTAQRFPLPNHVTSGCLSSQSLFPTGQR